jgi:hypothetical protein
MQVINKMTTAGYSYRPHLWAKCKFMEEKNIYSVAFWVVVVFQTGRWIKSISRYKLPPFSE